MKKESVFVFCLILFILSTSFASASWFSGIWNKITGNAISAPYCEQLSNLIQGSFNANCSSANYDKRADIDNSKLIDYGGLGLFSPNQDNEIWCLVQLNKEEDSCAPVIGTYCQNLFNMIETSMGKSCGQTNYSRYSDIDNSGTVDFGDFDLYNLNKYDEEWCIEKTNDQTNPCPPLDLLPNYDCDDIDYDGDGVVNKSDWDFFQLKFGSTNCDLNNSWCDGTDMDESGSVDYGDFSYFSPLYNNCTGGVCSDGTIYSACSDTKPKYCQQGNLVNNCGYCGCSLGKSCNTTTNGCYVSQVLQNESYFRFRYGIIPETFVFKLTNQSKIEEARKILNGTITDKTHVGGDIIKSFVSYNSPWSFYFNETSISFFENAIEVCDANPLYIEQHLSEVGGAFLPNNHWCPWESIIIEEVDISQVCNDGTLYNSCSFNKPKFCQDGNLINNCPLCGCSTNYQCELDESCSLIPIPTGENQKNMSLYSAKELFLVSDKNWKDVLPFVSAVVWNGSESCQKGYGTDDSTCVYPFLIWHEEDIGFDIDSSIYFMQQYSPDKVTIIGQTPQELDNLLIASPELGAGLQQNQIQRINPQDYRGYWQSYNSAVYVEDNYELALLASTYASLINAPLVIEGTSNDNPSVLDGRNLICVGSVSPTQGCSETYNLEQLQQKYVQETNTNKIILVNPNDLNIKVTEEFQPEKSANPINEIYSKTSLAAPILASAKKEIIMTSKDSNPLQIDNELEPKIVSYFKIPNESWCSLGDLCQNGSKTLISEDTLVAEKNFSLYFQISYNPSITINLPPLNKENKVKISSNFYIHTILANEGYLSASNLNISLYDLSLPLESMNSINLVNIGGFKRELVSFPITINELGIKNYRVVLRYNNGSGIEEKEAYINITSVNEDVVLNPLPRIDSFDKPGYSISFAGLFYNCSSDNPTVEIYNNGKFIGTKKVYCVDNQNDMFFSNMVFDDFSIDSIETENLPEPGVLEVKFYNSSFLTKPEYSGFNIESNEKEIYNCYGNTQCFSGFTARNLSSSYYNNISYFYIGKPKNATDFISIYLRDSGFHGSFLIYANGLLLGNFNGFGFGRTLRLNIPDELANENIVIMLKPVNTSLTPPIEDPTIDSNSSFYYDAKVKISSDNTNKYLTIFASHNAIPLQRRSVGTMFMGHVFNSLDQTVYSDFDEDDMPDISSGRLAGISISDVSSYVARDLLYDTIGTNYSASFLSGFEYTFPYVQNWSSEFKSAGYNSNCSFDVSADGISPPENNSCGTTEMPGMDWPVFWKDRNIVFYVGHGSGGYAGIASNDLLSLSNSFILTYACLTCSTQNRDSFCYNTIRNGALGFVGAVDVTSIGGDDIFANIVNNLYYSNFTIGRSFSKAYNNNVIYKMFNLNGDPTLKFEIKNLKEMVESS
ncbi:MAG: hypothetical protein KKE50_06370 [Nanoarchaeota archaeon]|nr:hypothetical protein [Nanoarchaeota archaeon]